jgi:hypothetical protein
VNQNPYDLPADAAGDVAAVMAARLQARVREAMADDTRCAAMCKAGLRGAIEALSGLVSAFDPQWDAATRRMFFLAVNLQATALRDLAVELLTSLDGDADGTGVAGV